MHDIRHTGYEALLQDKRSDLQECGAIDENYGLNVPEASLAQHCWHFILLG